MGVGREGVYQAAARNDSSVGLTQRTICTLPSPSLASLRSRRLINTLLRELEVASKVGDEKCTGAGSRFGGGSEK